MVFESSITITLTPPRLDASLTRSPLPLCADPDSFVGLSDMTPVYFCPIRLCTLYNQIHSKQSLVRGISETLSGSRFFEDSGIRRDPLGIAEAVPDQSSTISKSSLRAPHSGQVQFIGTSSQRVPAGIPSSGSPSDS